MKEELVRIHARLCGDGCICVYQTSESDRNKRGVVKYTNLVESNLLEFRNDMNQIFGIKMTLCEEDVKVKSLKIIEKLESKFRKFGSNQWRVTDEIQSLGSEKKYEWIRAFIRDEGYYNEKRDCLRIKSVNKTGLEGMRNLLEDLSIKVSISGPNCDETWYLSVYGVEKHQRLEKICKNKPEIK